MNYMMISDNILFTILSLNLLGYIFLNYKNIENINKFKLGNIPTWQILPLICIIGPIFEEVFFRLFLNKLLVDIGFELYTREISAITFGLIHSSNMLTIHNNLYGIIYQVYNTTILGYYLAGLPNIYYAILGHILYNTITISQLLLISYIKKKLSNKHLDDDKKWNPWILLCYNSWSKKTQL
jgi:membrane protease YdiL (CAAX protease family)